MIQGAAGMGRGRDGAKAGMGRRQGWGEGMKRRSADETALPLDAELADLPPDLRWREWMGRVEAAIFASAAPVPREALARLVGASCVLDDLIDPSKSTGGAAPVQPAQREAAPAVRKDAAGNQPDQGLIDSLLSDSDKPADGRGGGEKR